ncbi:MAG: glutamine-hydrolyzing carbamoyl-phosphate synthase small subunit, partial [Dehalococcoidia bacterium]
MKKAFLVLEDGSIYEGYAFGGQVESFGEVVFSTSMTGYQEMLTDPSFAGQIVVPTYPMIGNYGINERDVESQKIQVAGFVVREECDKPSHGLSNCTLDEYLKLQGIPGIAGIDTRALVRRLRSFGVMMGMVTSERTSKEALAQLAAIPRYDSEDFVKKVTSDKLYQWEPSAKCDGPRIVILDCGVKYNILRILRRLGCSVTAVPCTTPAEEILKLNPDGVLLSPGPGDPAMLGYLEKTVRTLVEAKPVMAICLGHQLIGRAFGAKTFKLKFGHRGANHPVRDLQTGRVYITAQNHGYAVDADTVKNGLEVTHINLNDG